MMGSENNMVAVPATALIDAWEAEWMAERGRHWGDSITWGSAREIAKRIDAARLASPQPDAQQGEEMSVTAHHPAILHLQANRKNVAPIYQRSVIDDTIALLNATPSSPALDAATIERCAEVADARRRDASEAGDFLGAHSSHQIAAAIRALPNAEKRHG